jgi:hypothetical protein
MEQVRRMAYDDWSTQQLVQKSMEQERWTAYVGWMTQQLAQTPTE